MMKNLISISLTGIIRLIINIYNLVLGLTFWATLCCLAKESLYKNLIEIRACIQYSKTRADRSNAASKVETAVVCRMYVVQKQI